jgi:hypothetical protein
MSDKTLQSDEFALGILGLIFSIGFLKANEVFEYFDHLDLFTIQASILIIHFRELLAVLLFSTAYIGFLITALFGVRSTSRRHAELGGTKSYRAIAVVMFFLLATQGFAFLGSFAHAIHKYGDAAQGTTDQRWDFNR